jgi:hypothetical protein
MTEKPQDLEHVSSSQSGLNGDSDLKELAVRVQTLGSLRLRDIDTGEVLLIPPPTNDPNDPLVSSSSDGIHLNRTGLGRSSISLRFWSVARSFHVNSLLPDQ